MSEEQDQVVETAAPEQESPRQPSAGAQLRAAREAAGLSLSELAAFLKVNAKKLEALETDQYELLPNAVFVRGLASSVCRALKMDSAPVLAQLPQTAAPSLLKDQNRNLNAPFRTPADLARVSVWDQLSRPMILAVLALLAAALVLILLPSMNRKPVPAPEAAMAEPPSAAPVAEPLAQPPAIAAPASVTTETTRVGAVSSKPGAGAALPVSPVAVPVPAPAPASSTQPVAVTGGQVAFKVSGPSWIEVTDAEGAVRLRRLLEAGESARVSGALPLSVVVGSADVTEVWVRGKPYSLDGISHSNVARFEVK